MTRFFLIIYLSACHLLPAKAQEKDTVDLLKEIKTAKLTEKKAELLLELSELYKNDNNFDKSLFYANRGLRISQNSNKQVLIKKFLKLSAENYYLLSNFKESFTTYGQLYRISEETNDLKYKAYALRGYSKNYWRQGLYQNAVSSGTEAAKIFEKLHFVNDLNITKINLASVYIDIKEYKQAEKICDELLSDKSNFEDTLFMADIYEKKGALKFYDNYFPYARMFYNKARKLYILKNKHIQAAVELGNIGETFEMEGNYSKAIKFYNRALATEKEYNFYSGMIFLYKAAGRTYSKNKNYNTAKQYFHKALLYIQKTGEIRELADIYTMLSALNAQTGHYKQAYEYVLKAVQFNDSLTGENVQNKINIIRIKYETEKAEKENETLRSKQISQKEKNKKQFFIIIIVTVLLFSLLVLSFLLYKYNTKNKNIKLLLEKQNNRLNIAYNDIKESIEYAGKIQNAMLGSYTETLKIFPEFIILYKPAFTLSGDFYWSKQINDTVFVAVADSTGHGVPGALLSITGMSFLNEIVTEDYIRTDVILNNLRSKIKHRLNQKGNFHEQSDGWDISLFSFNLKTYQGQFSGAYNSLYIISEKNNGKTIKKYKADRQPVGIYYIEKPFEHHNFKVKKGDIIWMFTDGYSDQYNEKGKKKFSSKRFKELLFTISDKPLNKQKDILNSEFKKWKGNFEQVDDILLTGIKI